jgi:hypothetical protein
VAPEAGLQRKTKRVAGRAERRAVAGRGLTPKEKSASLFKHRHVVVKRRGNLTESEHDDLRRML